MSKDNKPKLGEVKLSFFNRFAEAVNKEYKDKEDPCLPFELVIGSLFPTAYKNVMKEIDLQRANAFKEGYDAAKNEDKGNN